MVYIGTILHYDSVLARTLNNKAWTTARFKALLKPPSDMVLWDEWESLYLGSGEAAADRFYYEHRTAMDAGAVVSWAARPLLALMKIRARDEHATFDSEYQNDPVSGEDAPFAHVIQFWGELPRDLVYFGAVDPSLGRAGAARDPSAILVGGYECQSGILSLGRAGAARDPSAILVGGYERKSGTLYVVEAQIKKRLPDRIISDVIALHQRYRCLVWFVEAVQFQEFLRTELIRRSAAQGIPVPARAVSPHSDKMLRIESLQPHMANGLIRLHSEQATLISQLRHFPKADHDDGPDALHMLWAGAVAHGGQQVGYTAVPRHSDAARFGDGAW
nr:phage terminase large subunit [uncultured Cardiobacterium sp.]